jgi:hypothetical protein
MALTAILRKNSLADVGCDVAKVRTMKGCPDNFGAGLKTGNSFMNAAVHLVNGAGTFWKWMMNGLLPALPQAKRDYWHELASGLRRRSGCRSS